MPHKAVMAGSLEPTDCNDTGPHGYWMGTQDGTQIISNNFIDDMDKGNYMTLAPEEDGGSEAQGN